MKIYNKTNSIYTRYGRYSIIKNKLLYKIGSGSPLGLDCITLKQFIYKNRPFKILNYSLSSEFINRGVLIRQEIITNTRYQSITRKKNCISLNYIIRLGINSKNMKCSKLDIQMLYRVMNHLIRKNKINSI